MKRVIVLCYHRVYPGNHISPETFEQQMRYIAENFTCLDLGEAVEFARDGAKQNSKSSLGVVITFDDGWLDTFVYAYPILRKYGLHATVFVPTAFISDSPIIRPTLVDYWDGKIKYQDLFVGSGLNKPFGDFLTRGQSAEFSSWAELRHMVESGTIRVELHGHRHGYYFSDDKILGFYDGNLTRERNVWLSYALGCATLPGAPLYRMSSALAARRFIPARDMVSELVAERDKLVQSGMPSKVVNEALQKRAAQWARQLRAGCYETHAEWQARVESDLITAQEIIERELGTLPRYLCWPFGEYSVDSVRWAQQIGIQACFTTEHGLVHEKSDVWRMKRVGVPRNINIFHMLFAPGGLGAYTLALGVYSRMSGWIHHS